MVRIRAHKEIVVEKDPLILKLDNAILIFESVIQINEACFTPFRLTSYVRNPS